MNNLTYLLKKSKLLLILLLIGVLALLLLPLFLPTSEAPPATPQSSPRVVRGLPDFPSAQTQEFNNQTSREFGSLAVNSNIQNVSITIDQEEVTNSEFFAPENFTPFIIEKIPTGSHILRASKLGFLNQKLAVEIKANQILQISIELQTDPNSNALQNATSLMPISTDEYFIEYLDSIGKIQVIIRKDPFEEHKQQAIDWFKKQGVENPEESGVLIYPAVNINQ